MTSSAWKQLDVELQASLPEPWLPSLLGRDADCAYLRQYGSPRTTAEFLQRVPPVSYEDLVPWLDRLRSGEADVLFSGRPVAYERTGGSSGGPKLIAYSIHGLQDFQRTIVPWLARTVRAHGIRGKAYLAISPATRAAESIGGIPVGLPDGAYLGQAAGSILMQVSAVPPEVAAITDVEQWRATTLKYLAAAEDLELISVWSPTFMLRLLDDLADPVLLWPRLKFVSCWASAASQPFAAALAQRLPQARLQPKGLMSTECVVTVPDTDDRPVLSAHGYYEFEHEGRLRQAKDLVRGGTYTVIATTASGLYRYRTGDLVRCDGFSTAGAPVLEFTGRGSLASDLVGEKLVEPFVAGCLSDVGGFRFLAPESAGDGYLLIVESGSAVNLQQIEARLCQNPQYAYARELGQLRPVALLETDGLFDRYVRVQLARGVRLMDVKPVALRSERDWRMKLG